MSNVTFNEENFKYFISNPDNDNLKHISTDVGFNKSFDNLNFNQDINLHSDETYKKHIILNGCSFQKINILGATFSELLWFKNCVFENDFIIYEGYFRSILFDNCEFKEGLTIHNIEVAGSISLERPVSKNPIKIKGGIFQNLFYISASEKVHLHIEGRFTFIRLFELSTVIGATVSVTESIIKLLNIKGDYNSSSRVNFRDIKNFEISFNNVNNDGKFYLTSFIAKNIYKLKFPEIYDAINQIENPEVKTEVLHILKYNPKVKTFLQLYNHIGVSFSIKDYLYFRFFTEILKTDTALLRPQITIKYSSIGVLELKSMKLEMYMFNILSSDLSSIKLINAFFPTEIDAWTHSDGLSIFNDLYTSATKQNNVNDKIEYYKASQKFLLQKISSEKFSVQKVGSILAIKVSKIYSNHGSNWIQAALITIFVVALPLFGLFLWSLKLIYPDFSTDGFTYFFTELLPHFPEFLNPLHKSDFLEKTVSDHGKSSALIDLISRILIGIGIFEMVRSFRKYVRA